MIASQTYVLQHILILILECGSLIESTNALILTCDIVHTEDENNHPRSIVLDDVSVLWQACSRDQCGPGLQQWDAASWWWLGRAGLGWAGLNWAGSGTVSRQPQPPTPQLMDTPHAPLAPVPGRCSHQPPMTSSSHGTTMPYFFPDSSLNTYIAQASSNYI